MELAIEALSKFQLLGVAEWLISEEEHRVLVERAADLVERGAVLNLAKIDRADLGDKERMKLFEVQRHCRSR